MSKRSTKLIILLVCMIVVGGISFWVVSSENAKNATSTAATEPTIASFIAYSIDPDDITRIYWTYSNWVSFDLSLQADGSWLSKDDPDAVLLEEQVNEFLAHFQDIKGYKELSSENLQDFGLQDPMATVHVVLKDGTEVLLEFGDSTTVSGYCYMRINGQGPIYMVNRSFKSSLCKVLENFTTDTTATY